MTDDFAKVFRVDGRQVVVLMNEADDGPEVRWFYKPEGFGVSSVAFGYDDGDEGWDKRDDYFERLSRPDAEEIVDMFKKAVSS